MNIRRVVTGHDADGKAVVAIDEISKDLSSHRQGAQFVNIWSTSGFPVDNMDPADAAKQIRGTTRENGRVNSGKEACVIAFVLVSAKPVVAGGKALEASG